MDGQRFDALVSAWARSRFARRAGLRMLAGIAFAGVAGLEPTEANNKKKKKKKPPQCPGIQKSCGGKCIPFTIFCRNGKPGCPPCHLCASGSACEMMEPPDCEPCQQAVCKDGALQCVDKQKPNCTGCQQAVCKDGTFQCADVEGVTACGPNPDLCCILEENQACCSAPPQLGIPGNKFCVPREAECENQDCRRSCGIDTERCCDTLQKCCPGPNDTTICVLFGEPCPSV